jgi:LmeA-like phospholipid-binding
MQKLLIAIVVLVVLGVAADFGAARLFESRVTDALQRKYDLSERPIVQVRDFPFLPHLASGHFSTIDLAATDATTHSISVAALELHLRDVRVPRSVLLGGSGVVRVARTDGEVKLSQAELNRLLADRLQGGSLTLQAGKVQLKLTTQILGRSLTGTAVGRLGVREGRITYTPETVLVDGVRNPILEEQLASRLNFDVPLPPLPAGFTVERIDVQPGAVVLSGRAGALQIAA